MSARTARRMPLLHRAMASEIKFSRNGLARDVCLWQRAAELSALYQQRTSRRSQPNCLGRSPPPAQGKPATKEPSSEIALLVVRKSSTTLAHELTRWEPSAFIVQAHSQWIWGGT